MELLKICNEEFPSIVFVMLTNLQEFDLARDAIRYRAADYLLKVQLEAPALEESLQKAKRNMNGAVSWQRRIGCIFMMKKKQGNSSGMPAWKSFFTGRRSSEASRRGA